MNHTQIIQQLLDLIQQLNNEQPETLWIMEEGTTSRDLIDYALHVVKIDLNYEALNQELIADQRALLEMSFAD